MASKFRVWSGILAPKHLLKSKLRKPLLHLSHTVSLDLYGPTDTNSNWIIPRILEFVELQHCSEFCEEVLRVSRDLADACCHSGAVLSEF